MDSIIHFFCRRRQLQEVVSKQAAAKKISMDAKLAAALIKLDWTFLISVLQPTLISRISL